MISEDLFERNTRTVIDDGCTSISCNLGLWGICAPTLALARQEAYRYFVQYYADGEYDKPDTSVEDMIKECEAACAE